MRKTLVLMIILCLIFVAGCKEKQISPTSESLTCNKPYIEVGRDCCLDKDANSICDKDEQYSNTIFVNGSENSEKNVTLSNIKESECGDKFCTGTETCNSCEKDCGKCFSLSDLQANIDSVINQGIALTKLSEDDIKEVYTSSKLTTFLVGKIPSERGLPPTELFTEPFNIDIITVYKIKNEINFITSDSDFIDLLSKYDLLFNSINDSKAKFMQELINGTIKKKLFRYNSDVVADAESHIRENETILTNETKYLDLVGNKIKMQKYVSNAKYEVTYFNKYTSLYNFQEFNNYIFEEFYSVQCSPDIIISIRFLKKGDYTQYLKDRDLELNNDGFYSLLRNDENVLIKQASDLVNMCNKKYAYGHLSISYN